jgi:hypothetical protein
MARNRQIVEVPATKKEKRGNKKNKAPKARKHRVCKLPHRYDREIRKVENLISYFKGKEFYDHVPKLLLDKLASLKQAKQNRLNKIYTLQANRA